MHADRQEAEFATASAFDPSELRVHVIDDPFGARDELQSHRGEVSAPIRPFEQYHAKLALDLVYVRRVSWRYDLALFGRTIRVMIWSEL